jgi:hypothetical protein
VHVPDVLGGRRSWKPVRGTPYQGFITGRVEGGDDDERISWTFGSEAVLDTQAVAGWAVAQPDPEEVR